MTIMQRAALGTAVLLGMMWVGGRTLMTAASANQTTTAAAPKPPALSLAIEAHVQVGTPLEVGTVPRGRRRIVSINGGTFTGANGLKGRVLPGGADWQIIRPDGFAELDTRYTLETDAGQIIYVQNAGMRHAAPDVMARLNTGQTVDPSLVYFRTVATFETAAPELQWLTRAIIIGTGERYPNDVVVRFWRVE